MASCRQIWGVQNERIIPFNCGWHQHAMELLADQQAFCLLVVPLLLSISTGLFHGRVSIISRQKAGKCCCDGLWQTSQDSPVNVGTAQAACIIRELEKDHTLHMYVRSASLLPKYLAESSKSLRQTTHFTCMWGQCLCYRNTWQNHQRAWDRLNIAHVCEVNVSATEMKYLAEHKLLVPIALLAMISTHFKQPLISGRQSIVQGSGMITKAEEMAKGCKRLVFEWQPFFVKRCEDIACDATEHQSPFYYMCTA